MQGGLKDSREIHLDPIHSRIYESLQRGIKLSALTLDRIHAVNLASIRATLLFPITLPVTCTQHRTNCDRPRRGLGTNPRFFCKTDNPKAEKILWNWNPRSSKIPSLDLSAAKTSPCIRMRQDPTSPILYCPTKHSHGQPFPYCGVNLSGPWAGTGFLSLDLGP